MTHNICQFKQMFEPKLRGEEISSGFMKTNYGRIKVYPTFFPTPGRGRLMSRNMRRKRVKGKIVDCDLANAMFISLPLPNDHQDKMLLKDIDDQIKTKNEKRAMLSGKST